MRIACLLAFTLLVPQEKRQDPPKPERGPKVVRPKGRRSDRSPPGRAVRLGLAWLAGAQQQDGRWAARKRTEDIGVTGLALLAFLANGSTPRAGKFRRQVDEGTRWLLTQQGDDGLIGSRASHTVHYGHAIATWALVEAWGTSKSPQLAKAAAGACRYIQQARNPYKVWRYMPRDGDNDSSITGWMALALAAAREHGVPDIKADVFHHTLAWYEEVTHPGTGRVGYTKRGEGSARPMGKVVAFPPELSEPLTALGAAVRLRLGQTRETHPVLGLAAETVQDRPPEWKADRIDFYYWFHGSHLMARLGDPDRTRWAEKLRPMLVARQKREDPARGGSWDPDGVWCEEGGRVYATAMAVLSLTMLSPRNRLVR